MRCGPYGVCPDAVWFLLALYTAIEKRWLCFPIFFVCCCWFFCSVEFCSLLLNSCQWVTIQDCCIRKKENRNLFFQNKPLLFMLSALVHKDLNCVQKVLTSFLFLFFVVEIFEQSLHLNKLKAHKSKNKQWIFLDNGSGFCSLTKFNVVSGLLFATEVCELYSFPFFLRRSGRSFPQCIKACRCPVRRISWY